MLIERQSITKNNLNVFKRRIALNGTAKTFNQLNPNIKHQKFKKVQNNKQHETHQQFFNKFKQSSGKSQKVKEEIEKQLQQQKKGKNKNQKIEKKFLKILENIQQRGGSFCRFGFKSHQKSHRKLFGQVLNVVPSKMKGTMHVGEIWSSSQTSRFMKQNKIYINKLKLMDKLKQAKSRQQKQLIQSTTSLYQTQSKNSISLKLFQTHLTSKSRLSINQIPNNTYKQLNKTMDEINKKLKSLKPFYSTQKYMEKIKLMEDCLQKINSIDYSYHEQIAEWM